jgi:hypothetical protein
MTLYDLITEAISDYHESGTESYSGLSKSLKIDEILWVLPDECICAWSKELWKVMPDNGWNNELEDEFFIKNKDAIMEDFVDSLVVTIKELSK